MKKMKTLRMGAVVTALALLTMCLSGNTFAKYNSANITGASSHVAYWGFDTNMSLMDISDLFEANMSGVSEWEKIGGDDAALQIGAIAPGTQGSTLFGFIYENPSNTPEVDYNFSVEAYGTLGGQLESNEAVKFRLDEGEWGTFQELLSGIKALAGDSSGKKKYTAGTLPEAFADGVMHTIEWAWTYEYAGEDEFVDPDSTYYPNDGVDTLCGEDESLECSIQLVVRAVQVAPTAK